MLPRRATVPLRIGPYELIERLAQGGMAAVYKARLNGPSGFEKVVVVKSMLPALTSHEELVQLFCAEARLSAQLNHPNIVSVLDFGMEDGTPYLVMEYLDGWTLSQLRDRISGQRGRWPVGAALKVARDLCLALGYAHNFVDRDGVRRQIIHRDVSPSNVIICKDGTVKLLDFGIARVATPSGFEETRSFRGKYAYMAPEQVQRKPIDRRVDVFAVGTVLHEMLTGKRLFASVSELETLERVAAAQVTAPSGENPEVPRVLDAIVKKALARDANARYSSGSAMAQALDALESDILSRRGMQTTLRQIFPEAFTVVCEVCGKQVAPGHECGECGTPAPFEEAAIATPKNDTTPNQIDDDAQPLPPPPVLPPSRRVSPPHLFVVPKLPERQSDDDSVKMGVTRLARRATPKEGLKPQLVLDDEIEPDTEKRTRTETPRARASVDPLAATQPAPAIIHAEPVSLSLDAPPELRGNGRGAKAAMILVCLSVVGIGLTLLWPSAPQPIARTESQPAPARIIAPIVIEQSTVVVANTPAPMIKPRAIAKRVAPKKPRVLLSSTVRDGRIVDPFAGGD